eukprot:XP_017457108.1 PREDICTED: receptor expression-enhancing protein 3 isoform X1 [Rattus norvegicus]
MLSDWAAPFTGRRQCPDYPASVCTGAAPSQTLPNPGSPNPGLGSHALSPPARRPPARGSEVTAQVGGAQRPPGSRSRRLSAERRGGAGRAGGAAARERAAGTASGAAPGTERAACGQRPSGRKDGVLDDLPSRGLVFGMLYPAYYSYKAVKTKNVKEYVRWMMYWIVFALYTVIETVADQTLAWFPLYYELKIAFVIWLLSPYTRGASLIYRKFLHPLLSSKEREIDDYIVQAKERGYETMVNFGRQGLNLAAAAAVTAAVKSQGAITERLRSFSMHDLTAIQGDEPVGHRPYQTLPEAKRKGKQATESPAYGIPLKDGSEQTDEEAEGPFSDDEMVTHKGLRRSQSMKSVKTIKGRKEVRYGSLKYKVKKRPQVYF